MNETNKWLEEMKIDSLSSLSERARQEAKDQLQTLNREKKYKCYEKVRGHPFRTPSGSL